MKKKLIWLVPAAILGMALFTFIGGEVVMHLWNWLTPSLFGLRAITFWEALGLLALCRILFGGFGFHDSGRKRRFRKGGCDHMTPEERERFRQSVRARWDFSPPPGESNV